MPSTALQCVDRRNFSSFQVMLAWKQFRKEYFQLGGICPASVALPSWNISNYCSCMQHMALQLGGPTRGGRCLWMGERGSRGGVWLSIPNPFFLSFLVYPNRGSWGQRAQQQWCHSSKFRSGQDEGVGPDCYSFSGLQPANNPSPLSLPTLL